ncbi:MAG: HAD family hydrolase [Microbacterium sp.]|uniref:HAD family hydrolase n=1 Tax=Microbacterium sp. TaxID=51671 RepID=UPI00260E3F0C|nr:HAD family hydrolase [Microbacterium sp.]MCX6501078.1 HAD family hydrolase [Microbacterium sp.]
MSETSRVKAVLFDIDGTLVDSNYLHVDAWMRGIAEAGETAQAARVHEGIGLDSAKLLERLFGERADSDAVARAKDLHGEYYTASADRLRRFADVHELFTALRERGVAVVLASSAPQEELDILLRVLDADDLIDDATSSSDVDTAKPEPDLIAVALSKAGVEAGEALMVGDTRWDVEAARRAGVDTVAVLTGGRGEHELRDAGAVAVYADIADLLEHLEEALGARER